MNPLRVALAFVLLLCFSFFALFAFFSSIKKGVVVVLFISYHVQSPIHTGVLFGYLHLRTMCNPRFTLVISFYPFSCICCGFLIVVFYTA
jgi:hypothetical protein